MEVTKQMRSKTGRIRAMNSITVEGSLKMVISPRPHNDESTVYIPQRIANAMRIPEVINGRVVADVRCVRGDPPNPQQMQAGRAQEGGNTTPLVVGTANGLRRPRSNWIRQISPGLCFLSFAWGGVCRVCTRQRGVCPLV